ncbi:MAG: sucrase ferredoxin [Acidimicrobiales bacterium]
MSAVDAAEVDPARRDPDYRCSPWTQAQAVDPIGSAGAFDELLLVEWALPWPSDVSDVDALAAAAAHPGARVMMVVPHADAAEDGLRRVVHHRRTSTHRLTGVDHRVEVDRIPDLLAALLAEPDRPQHEWPSVVGDAPAEVLVCGHGRRDPCCGRWGTLLHLETAARGLAARVWRCSHTGGHRYAPTAITLPDGRAWAYADVDLLEGVLTRSGDVGALCDHDRGCTALDPWAQVVERALFVEHGWAWLDGELTSSTTQVADDARSASVELHWRSADGTAGSAVGEVEVTRVLPVLVCGEPPENAKKTSPELALRSLRARAS